MLEEAGIDVPSGLLKTLVEMFVQNTTQRLKDIFAAVQANQLSEVGRIAHDLKASCGAIGAEGMFEAANFIELQVGSQSREGIADAIQSLQEQFPSVEMQLRNYLKSVPI